MKRFKIERRGNCLVIFDTKENKTLQDQRLWFNMLDPLARRKAAAECDKLNLTTS